MSLPLRIAVAAFALAVALISQAGATTVLDLPLQAQVARASAIVKGRVAGVRSVLVGRVPYTEVTLVVDEWLKGRGEATVTFKTAGGRFPDGRVLRVEGAPSFAPGDNVCLLLTLDRPVAIPIVAIHRGYYALAGSDERVRDSRGRGISRVDAEGKLVRAARAEDAVRWPAFRDLIRQQVKRGPTK